MAIVWPMCEVLFRASVGGEDGCIDAQVAPKRESRSLVGV